METMEMSQLGRAGASIGNELGYKRGVEDTLAKVSKWLDEETLDYVKEELLGGK